MSARIAGLVNRLIPKVTSDVLRWATGGYDDEDDTQDVFQGTGFAARPADGSEAEAIAVAVNGYDHHVIIATRDATTLQQVVGALGLEAGETLMFGAGTAVKCTAQKITAKSFGGVAASLAFKSELVAVQNRLHTIEQRLIGHLHTSTAVGAPVGAAYVLPGPTTGPIPSTTPVTINGSVVLEGE